MARSRRRRGSSQWVLVSDSNMSKRKHKSLRMILAVVAGMLALLGSSDAGTRAVGEHDLSAALTLRIAKFVEWPDRPTLAEDKAYFLVGVMGNAQTRAAFAQFEGKIIKGKKVRIVKVNPSTDSHDLRRCHIIYADASSDQSVLTEITQRGKGVMTLFGPRSGNRKGSCLSLIRLGDKLAFDIDLQSTRRSDLQIDAGLIRLARKVKK
jgi:hypothetical protein